MAGLSSTDWDMSDREWVRRHPYQCRVGALILNADTGWGCNNCYITKINLGILMTCSAGISALLYLLSKNNAKYYSGGNPDRKIKLYLPGDSFSGLH